MRVSRKELVELIESIEAGGGDATELRAELSQLEPPARPQMPARGGAMQLEREELTTEDRLGIEVGDLFTGGITTDILNKLYDLDGQYNLKQLKTMCVEAGLSANGHKKKLAAKLLARGYFMEATEKGIAEGVDLNKQKEWEGKLDDLRMPESYLKDLKFEITIFVRKERGKSDFKFRCKEYEKTTDGGWRFGGVIIETSNNAPQSNVEMARITYHPEVVFVNTAFMVLLLPDLDGNYR